MTAPLSTLDRQPASQAELVRLAGLWGSRRPSAAILAEMWPRTARDVLLMLDRLLGPDRPLFDDDWEPRALDRALVALAGRARRRHDLAVGFELDGRPADAGRVVAAANAVLVALGYPPIPWPPRPAERHVKRRAA